MTNTVYYGDNLEVLRSLSSDSVRLIYIDPPFNTGKKRIYSRKKAERIVSTVSYDDSYDDFVEFLGPRLHEAKRVLTPDGSIFVHLDWREAHYVKIFLDKLFGRDHFMNEIIWAYDFGARSRKKWPTKHDTILWYVVDKNNYVFNYDEMDRIPYMAPGLVGKEKAARGKTPTDVWWHTIVGTNAKERTGYPTQKPLAILNRIIKVHSSVGDTVLDFFAGSGTTAEAAASNNRSFMMVDNNKISIEVMVERLNGYAFELVEV